MLHFSFSGELHITETIKPLDNSLLLNTKPTAKKSSFGNAAKKRTKPNKLGSSLTKKSSSPVEHTDKKFIR